jgi:YidC/Oxa1 family membrane protein insertase
MISILNNNSRSLRVFLLALCVLVLPITALGNVQSNSNSTYDIAGAIENFIASENKYTYFGLASSYNHTSYYVVNKTSATKVEIEHATILQEDEWLAVVSRLNVLAVKASGLSIELVGANLNVDSQAISTNPSVKIVAKSELSSIASELDQIRYIHLWKPLAWLAKFVESALVLIQENIISNWGLSIGIFAVLLKILLLPVGMMTSSIQRQVSKIQTQLAPKLAAIKASYDGEEAHNLLMAAHKELGVSPLYILKPMLGTFIQVPIWIAVFNALGEMPQLDGQSFLWIDNLALPDTVGRLPFAIPILGDKISLLPFIMTVVSLYSTVLFQNRHASALEMKRQKRNLYLMAVAFFVLFYPFPAAMVLYWAMANFLYTIQQSLIKI